MTTSTVGLRESSKLLDSHIELCCKAMCGMVLRHSDLWVMRFERVVSEAQVHDIFTYLQDGSFFDEQTKDLGLHVPLYNPQSGLFTSMNMYFRIEDGKCPLTLQPVDQNLPSFWRVGDSCKLRSRLPV